MSNLQWEKFPFWEPRPVLTVFGEDQRQELEGLISLQVADLLGMYASIGEVELDVSACIGVDECQTYKVLELDPFLLEDGGELQVYQAPFLGSSPVVTPGCHGVCKEDEYGRPEFEAIVWDPNVEQSPKVTDNSGDQIELGMLNELYAAMIIATKIISQIDEAKTAPNNTAMFPARIPDIDFDAIITANFSV